MQTDFDAWMYTCNDCMHRITINVPSALAVEFNSNIVIKLENETVSRVFKCTKNIFCRNSSYMVGVRSYYLINIKFYFTPYLACKVDKNE